MSLDAAAFTVAAGNIRRTLDLSESRAYDRALEILAGLKLTGNFHINLEIVLKDLGLFDKVTFEVEPKLPLRYFADCRRVAFRPNATVRMDAFEEIMRSLERRIGFEATRSWWDKVFHRPLPRAGAFPA